MYDKVLVAVGQSPVSGRVVLAARDLAQPSKGEVWVLRPREFERGGRAGALPSRESSGEADAGVAASTPVQSRKGPTSRLAAWPSDGPGRRNPVQPLAGKGDIRLWRRRDGGASVEIEPDNGGWGES